MNEERPARLVWDAIVQRKKRKITDDIEDNSDRGVEEEGPHLEQD